MITLTRVEEEISQMHKNDQLRWIEGDEQDDSLLEDKLLFDILHFHNQYSQIFSFIINNRAFHFLVHYDPQQPELQDGVRFFWNTETPLLELSKNI